MKKIKVLHIIPYLATGGAEKLVFDLVCNIDADRFEVTVLCLYPKGGWSFEKELYRLGHKVLFLDKKVGLDFSMPFKINRVIKELKPQVLHLHLAVTKYVLLPAMLNNIPVRIQTIHSTPNKESTKLDRYAQKIAFKIFKFVPVAISDIMQGLIEQFYNIKKDKIPLIYNGVDIEKYSVKDKKSEDSIIKIVHVGRFIHTKRHKLLIEAFSILLKEIQGCKLILAGDGVLKNEAQELVNRIGIQENVQFMGDYTEIPKLLSQCDIFVLCSDWEGLPLSVLEAMAAGLPIVATNVGGIPDIVKENGILVPPGDVQMLAEAMLTLINDNATREHMARVSTELVKQYDIKNSSKSYEDIYIKLLNKKGWSNE